MSEWIGWVGRLRRMIYHRMEELSFRTGAATVAGVLAVAATAILLTLTQGGHHAGPRHAEAGLAPTSFEATPITASSPSATHHSHRSRPTAGPEVRYVPTKTPTARPQPAPSPSHPSSLRTFWTNPPVKHKTPNPPPSDPFPWPTPTWPFGQGG
ncbi:MAG: hypothetical protein ACRDOU_12145 [Streptosporangiaceae bacterium]